MNKSLETQRMEKIVSLCKRRGFIFQSSEIYGGLNGCWDYGPLGVELKRNLKNYWWRVLVHERDDVIGMDGSILMNRAVWKASGHEDTFKDPMVESRLTNRRFKADQIPARSGAVVTYHGAYDRTVEEKFVADAIAGEGPLKLRILMQPGTEIRSPEKLVPLIRRVSDPHDQRLLEQIIAKYTPAKQGSCERFSVLIRHQHDIDVADKVASQFYEKCGVRNPVTLIESIREVQGSRGFDPEDGAELTAPRGFNLMFKTYVGATQDESSLTYLRPETAQAIFVQFKNVLEVSRKKLPFGIAQIGKAFRNEINPRNFTFRSREFEQMELEYFCRAEEGIKWLDYWLEERLKFYENIGIPRAKLHAHEIPDEERAFYSKGTYDIEYDFPFGRQELEGVAYRTDYDLQQHIKASGKPLDYFDEETKQRLVPHVVEPSAGVDRTVLALICEAYDEDTAPDEKGKLETRVVLRFHPRMAPIKCSVFPLLKNNEQLVAKAKEIANLLRPHMNVFYDETGAIGRRYRRQDEIGTPFGVTVDFETLGGKDRALQDTVTLRDRDSMKQERVKISELIQLLSSRIA
jgi:glycyl-tRNA synthetase